MFVCSVFICFLFFKIVLSTTDVFTINLNELSQCDPNKVYKDGNRTCICTNNGTWPNQECVSYFGSETRNENCVPNKYIFIDCNVCLCGPDGKFNKNRCSQHNCLNLNKSRRSDPLPGRCHPKRFYQFGKCQFCWCIHQYKLICNYRPKLIKLKLGPFELFKCSELMLKELNYIAPGNYLRSQKNAYRARKGSAKRFKMMTTAILLEEPNKKSLEKLKDSNDKNTIVNIQNQNSFESANYDKNYSEMSKNSDVSDNLSIEIDQKKSFNEKSKSDLDPIGYISDLKNEKSKSDLDPIGYISDEKNLGHNLTIDIPSVLNKVMSLVIRKSMVSLGSGNNCKPGSKIKDKCHTCFCLSNGKMLCTKKTC